MMIITLDSPRERGAWQGGSDSGKGRSDPYGNYGKSTKGGGDPYGSYGKNFMNNYEKSNFIEKL